MTADIFIFLTSDFNFNAQYATMLQQKPTALNSTNRDLTG